MSDITFITAIFGERYMPFLLPHIYSIKKVYPNAKNFIYYSRIDKSLLNLFEKFDNIEFIEMETKDSTKHDMFNDRMLAWERGSTQSNGFVVLIDVDIMLLKPISHFFKEDIVYTYRENHQFPLNLGILLLYNGKASYEFMKELTLKTNKIYNSPNMQYARSVYGSCDQKAMFDLIKSKKYKISGVSCKFLNEVNCNLTDNTHAIHYKTSWHSIILDRHKWNKNKLCLKAYNLWNAINLESNLFLDAVP